MLPKAFPKEFTRKSFSVLRGGCDAPMLKADDTPDPTVAIIALSLSIALGIASRATRDKAPTTDGVAGLLISRSVTDVAPLPAVTETNKRGGQFLLCQAVPSR